MSNFQFKGWNIAIYSKKCAMTMTSTIWIVEPKIYIIKHFQHDSNFNSSTDCLQTFRPQKSQSWNTDHPKRAKWKAVVVVVPLFVGSIPRSYFSCSNKGSVILPNKTRKEKKRSLRGKSACVCAKCIKLLLPVFFFFFVFALEWNDTRIVLKRNETEPD